MDPNSFTEAMADILRLPDESLAMTYVYLNRYRRFQNSSQLPGPLDASTTTNENLAILQTLALACLSLSSKSTENPRRMREILLPAHRLLHHNKAFVSEPVVQPLTIPSTTYDTLRATLVQAELVLLRILGFDLRIPLPLEYLPRYLERAMEDVAGTNEDYDSMGKEEMEEFGVLQDFMETRIGRACKAQAISACKDYRLANLYPARAVALGCLSVVMEARGLRNSIERREWATIITGRKVDAEDLEEVVEALKGTQTLHFSR